MGPLSPRASAQSPRASHLPRLLRQALLDAEGLLRRLHHGKGNKPSLAAATDKQLLARVQCAEGAGNPRETSRRAAAAAQASAGRARAHHLDVSSRPERSGQGGCAALGPAMRRVKPASLQTRKCQRKGEVEHKSAPIASPGTSSICIECGPTDSGPQHQVRGCCTARGLCCDPVRHNLLVPAGGGQWAPITKVVWSVLVRCRRLPAAGAFQQRRRPPAQPAFRSRQLLVTRAGGGVPVPLP